MCFSFKCGYCGVLNLSHIIISINVVLLPPQKKLKKKVFCGLEETESHKKVRTTASFNVILALTMNF